MYSNDFSSEDVGQDGMYTPRDEMESVIRAYSRTLQSRYPERRREVLLVEGSLVFGRRFYKVLQQSQGVANAISLFRNDVWPFAMKEE